MLLLHRKEVPAQLQELSIYTFACLHITGDISIVLSLQFFKSLWKQQQIDVSIKRTTNSSSTPDK